MPLSDLLSIIQTASLLIGIIVAATKLKDRSADKSGSMIEMQIDVRYIKEAVSKLDPIPAKIIQIEATMGSLKTKLDEHIKHTKT